MSCELVGQVVCPGQTIIEASTSEAPSIGRGLSKDGQHIVAHSAGIVQQQPNGKIWIQNRTKRYIPQVNDEVIGIITRKNFEQYEVDINAPSLAILNVLAFEGASRRNRPMLQEGDVVYARVETADKDIQPTLVCTDTAGKSRNETFGPLKEGMTFNVSTSYAITLNTKPDFLNRLGNRFEFELMVGVNGRVWVKGASTDAVCVRLVIQQAEGVDAKKQSLIVEALAQSLAVGGGGK